MVLFILRRVATGVLVVLATAFVAYGGWRLLRPELFGGQPWFSGTLDDLKQTFIARRPDVLYWKQQLEPDVFMVAGTVGVGLGIGMPLGGWCIAHDRSRRARAVQAFSTLFLCMPPYVLAFGCLLAFGADFGAVRIPLFFNVHVYQPPYDNPWDFLRAMLVPWVVAGLPLTAACIRITTAATREAVDEDFMRTALSKGLSHRTAVREHARPASLPVVMAYLSTSAGVILLNVIMVETVFSVPGLLGRMRQAMGDSWGLQSGHFQVPVLQLVAIWNAVLIVAVGIVFEVMLRRADPRIRTG